MKRRFYAIFIFSYFLHSAILWTILAGIIFLRFPNHSLATCSTQNYIAMLTTAGIICGFSLIMTIYQILFEIKMWKNMRYWISQKKYWDDLQRMRKIRYEEFCMLDDLIEKYKKND